MSRIKELFDKKKSNILNVYCTAGFPSLEDTVDVMEALQESGADLIELGMPYSDPLADGPVIQASSLAALQNGMTLQVLFRQLKDFRKRISVPVILMGYMNPILQYGFEKFCADAARCGVDGLILPDLPVFEFEQEYGDVIRKHRLDFIFLVTPETPDERVRKLDSLSSGFLYAVSSSSTTGKDKDFSVLESYFKRLRDLGVQNPVLVGFGVKDRETFRAVAAHAQGAIVGSAFIRYLEQRPADRDLKQHVRDFVESIRGSEQIA